jgi:hypothetical protein
VQEERQKFMNKVWLVTGSGAARFAERALTLRYPEPERAGIAAPQLLNCRSREDTGDGLYSTLNRVQENLAVSRGRRLARLTIYCADSIRSGRESTAYPLTNQLYYACSEVFQM